MWLALAIVLANIVGAVIVFGFANFVVPTPELPNETEVRLVNLVGFGAYLGAAIVVGNVWGFKRMRALSGFLNEERAPTPEERRQVLTGPIRLAVVNAVLWVGGAAIFGIINLTYSGQLAIAVGTTALLGGITTTAIAYMLSERVLRAATAAAMAAKPPRRPVAPGVATKSVIAWALGTGVPLMGIVVTALYVLGGEEGIDREELAVTVLALSAICLVIGLLAVVLAARATSDPINSVRDALADVERGEYEVEVPVYDASELGLLQAGFNRMVAGLRERERLREAFGTYVDRDVAEHILKEGTVLEGEEVEATVMFLDIRDFTGFAASRPAKEVVAALNRMFGLVVPIVREYGGHVDKFVGDGLLAVFGAPRRADDHADRALDAAIEIAGRISEALADEMRIGIGLNSGAVVAGNIGGAGRLDFSVIGDVVNVAARVEAATRDTGDTILLSGETRAELRSERELIERPDVELKGKGGRATLYTPAD